jgi:hypothetical protein
MWGTRGQKIKGRAHVWFKFKGLGLAEFLLAQGRSVFYSVEL